MPAKPHRPLHIIHTSDVHLETDTFGSGERGVQLRDKVRNSFGRVIDIANDREADMLLIVGDLFDSARVTEEGLAFAFGTIARARMPVVMIPAITTRTTSDRSTRDSLRARFRKICI